MAQFDVDFSPIGNLGNVYNRARQQAVREQALSQLGQGSGPLEYGQAARALLSAGDTEGGLTLARLAEAATRDQRDFAFRQDNARREQANADRSFRLQERQVNAGLEGKRVPAGFERDPASGGLRPVKGGPQDPTYIQATTEAKDKGKQFNAGEIGKLVEEGGKFTNLASFANQFQDRFAGYKSNLIGNPVMTAGRFLPEGVVGKDVAEGAAFWQGYDRYKNQVRNELFGSALTANEQAAFERADVSPGMDPAQIRKNLETQQGILKEGMKRKAGALIAGGYPAEPIARAYGLKLEDLGVDTSKKGKTTTATTTTAATSPPEGAIAALRAQPALKDQFDAKYGAGAAARVLGGQ